VILDMLEGHYKQSGPDRRIQRPRELVAGWVSAGRRTRIAPSLRDNGIPQEARHYLAHKASVPPQTTDLTRMKGAYRDLLIALSIIKPRSCDLKAEFKLSCHSLAGGTGGT